jgi:hypothetical protein
MRDAEEERGYGDSVARWERLLFTACLAPPTPILSLVPNSSSALRIGSKFRIHLASHL